jgi:ribosomal protein L37E
MDIGETETDERKCGNCGNASMVETLKSKADTGFVRCALRKSYEWIAPRLACRFNPSKWKSK